MSRYASMSEEFTYRRNGICYLKICLDLSLYFSDSLLIHADEVIGFYEKCLERLGSHLKFYQTDSMGKPKKVSQKALDALPFWMKTPESRRPFMMQFLESGPGQEDVSDRAFALVADELNGTGYVRLMLPVLELEQSPAAFRDQVCHLAGPMRFASGMAGFSLNRQIPGRGPYADHARAQQFALSQRYLGIDVVDMTGSAKHVAEGIKCVNWLTLINPLQVAAVGGEAHIRSVLSEECPIFPLEHGLLIQGGPEPGLGDVNRGEDLLHYRRVGRLLKTVRMRDHSAFLQGDKGISMQWLSRFDT